MIPLLLTLALSSPAHAIGVVAGTGPTPPQILSVRGFLAADDVDAAAAAQVMVEHRDAPWVWLVPLPAGERDDLKRMYSEELDRYFLSTSVALDRGRGVQFEVGCAGEVRPTKALRRAREVMPIAYFWEAPQTDVVERSSSRRVLNDNVAVVLEELETAGYNIAPAALDELEAHAQAGGDLLVVEMDPRQNNPGVGVTDVFAWRLDPLDPSLPLGISRHSAAEAVLVELGAASPDARAPSAYTWWSPVHPDIEVVQPDQALSRWSVMLEQAAAQDSAGGFVHLYLGDAEQLRPRLTDFVDAMAFQPKVLHTIFAVANTPDDFPVKIPTGFVRELVDLAEYSIDDWFTELFTGSYDELLEADNILRRMQKAELMPDGWRRGDQRYTAFVGALDGPSLRDTQLLPDAELQPRETSIGSGWQRQPAGVGLAGLLMLVLGACVPRRWRGRSAVGARRQG